MRDLFIQNLTNQAKINKKIVLVVGDLGFGVVETFKEKFPKRFYNAGVAEQSMMGIATGLAMEGFHVFVYSIANFPTFRCAEQIRNDVDYHKSSITIVSVGSGVGYGNLGYSHHGIQDFALMRSFPNMLIASPSDETELIGCLNYLYKNPQPSYLRLDKSLKNKNSNKVPVIKPGKWIFYKKINNKNIVISTGATAHNCNNLLKTYSNYDWCTIPMWGMKSKLLQAKKLAKYKNVITVENHLQDGGFGSWLNESLLINKNKINIISKFFNNKVIGVVGSEDYLNSRFGPK